VGSPEKYPQFIEQISSIAKTFFSLSNAEQPTA
jgi:autonomous glycyl radical cofactor GrcA